MNKKTKPANEKETIPVFGDKQPYITDVENYIGPIDRVSPYHYYQFTYWKLRGYWRGVLYAWTRRQPCDAKSSVEPSLAVAGVPTAVTLTVTIGKTPLCSGGRIAVYCQKDFGGAANANVGRLFQGPDGQTGYGSRITAGASRDGVELRVRVHSTGSIFTCAEVFVESGRLQQGDAVKVVFGDRSSKPQVVCEKAKVLPFRVAVDYGSGEFHPVAKYPFIRVVGNRAGG